MTEDRVERRLAAILVADMVGYSRLMEADELGTLERQKAHRRDVIDPTLERYRGHVVKNTGDGVLAEFPSIVDAVKSAVAIQQTMARNEDELPEEQRIQYRIGINLGDVIPDSDDLFGDGVNVAARLEQIADPGGICISGTAYDQLRTNVEVGYESLGEVHVKNIQRSIRAYRVLFDDVSGGVASGPPVQAPAPSRPARGRAWRNDLIAIAAVLIAVAGVVWWSGSRPGFELASTTPEGDVAQDIQLQLPERPSIAVLPFTNMSDDEAQEYFVDGMTDDLITRLANVSGLFVIARNSVFTYKGRNVKVQDVGRELGVRYVLEGSVRRADDKIRINAQLIDASDGGHLWADIFDRGGREVFSLQDEVTNRIVEALKITLTPEEEQRVARIPTESTEAFDLFLKAREYHHQFDTLGRGSLKMALDLYQEAIASDPGFADAHAGDAGVATFLAQYFSPTIMSQPEAVARAEQSIARALELDPVNSLALQAKAYFEALQGRHDQALQTAERLVGIHPDDASARRRYAIILAISGKADAALVEIEKAARIDPKPNARDTNLIGSVLFHSRQYGRAAETFRELIKRVPESTFGYYGLAISLAMMGRTDEARELLPKILSLVPATNRHSEAFIYGGYLQPDVLDHYVDALRLAGIPNWPFDYEANEADRLTAEEVRRLTWGKTLAGSTRSLGSFDMTFAENGSWTIRFRSGIEVGGKSYVEGDDFCLKHDGLRKPFCYDFYRNQDAPELIYPTHFDILFFRLPA